MYRMIWFAVCSVIMMLLLTTSVYGNWNVHSICELHAQQGSCSNSNVAQRCPDVCGNNQTVPATIAPSSNTTTNCDKKSPCVSMEQANTAFYNRCEATNGALKNTCYSHCRYDEDTHTMKHAFLSKACPLDQLRKYLTAASNGRDNTGCCQDLGVLSKRKTGVCGCFCNPTGPVWPGKGEAAKYGPCVGVLEQIMQCHYFAEGAD